MEYITQYRNFQDSYNRTIKYKFLRPKYEILEDELDESCEKYNHNPNARMWWRYAIECVCRTIRMKNGTGNLFKLSPVAEKAISKKYMHYYSKIFAKKQELKDREEGTSGGVIPQIEEDLSEVCKELNIIEHNALQSDERHEYNYILAALDTKTLKEWSSTVVRKHQEKFKEEESRKSASGGIWSMFSWATGSTPEEEKQDQDQADGGDSAKKTEFHISDEELKEINRVVQNAIDETNEEDNSDGNLMIHVDYE